MDAAPPLIAEPAPPEFVQLHQEDAQTTRAELAAGLLADRPQIAPKYFYDALGSRLFDAITALEEYYPTRTEAAIFDRHLPDIVSRLPRGCTLIDLGAGNCEKAARLLQALQPQQYVAVDISAEFVRQSLHRLQQRHPATRMLGIGMDFAQGLALPAQVRSERRVFFYPGSSIGNFAPDEALRLLKHVRAADAGDGALLIGIDHPKPRELLEPAYDDALGVTAAFNLNVLRHVNRLLGSDFDVRQWQHVAFYDGRAARIEMHLQARCALGVRWPGAERRFAAGARIHTENSYKYSVDAVSDLLVSAGYPHITGWRDERGWFGVYLAHG